MPRTDLPTLGVPDALLTLSLANANSDYNSRWGEYRFTFNVIGQRAWATGRVMLQTCVERLAEDDNGEYSEDSETYSEIDYTWSLTPAEAMRLGRALHDRAVEELLLQQEREDRAREAAEAAVAVETTARNAIA